MSKITYLDKVALNVNSDIADINKVNAADMNEIKQTVNSNETKILLAVSSSAPATCSTGDMYFDTTTNLIYTATATNTWGTTGVAPTSNTIYIVFSTNSTYAYNGTTLISVGGGQVENSYSTSQTNAYSSYYSNNTFELKGKILWYNPNPTSNFNAQQITLNSNDYDMYEILCAPSAASSALSNLTSSGRVPKGSNYKCQYLNLASNDLKYRGVTFDSDTKLTFTTGYDTGITSPNITQGIGHLIPEYVIGYKTGLF